MAFPWYTRSTPGDPFNDSHWINQYKHESRHQREQLRALEAAKRGGGFNYGMFISGTLTGFAMGTFVGGSVMVLHSIVSRQFKGLAGRAFTAGASFGTIFAIGNLIRTGGDLWDE